MNLILTSVVYFCLAVVACTPPGDIEGPGPATITGSVAPTSATVSQAGYQPVNATITRTGSYSGAVHFAVTGLPTGATASVSNRTELDGVTTAVVNIFVELATAPGTYTLVVHASGDGTGTATALFTLTVVPAVPGFTLSMASQTLTSTQGSDPTVSVAVSRLLFTGPVTLSVENLPAGVTVSFSPPNPIPGSSTIMTLVVPPGAVLPPSTALLLRGTADGLVDRTVAFTLLWSGYTMHMANTALTVPQGQSSLIVVVTLSRTSFTGAVSFSLLNLPPNVSAVFSPFSTTGNTTSFDLSVPGSTITGTYNLVLRGVATGLPDVTVPVTLTVTGAAPGYSLQMGIFALSAPQGQTTGQTVLVNRTNFTGSVAFSVDNLPVGVTATFFPAATTFGSTFMQLNIPATAPPGTYSNLVLRGVAAGLSDRTITFTLNITVAPFTFQASATAVTIARGSVATPITMTIVRNNFAGPISLRFDDAYYYILPPGMTAEYSPNPATGNSSVLTLTAGPTTPVGSYSLYAYAIGGSFQAYIPFVVTITP